MKNIWIFLVLINLGACAYHEQSTTTLQPEDKSTVVAEEQNPNLALVNAINEGDFESVQKMIEEGAVDINYVSEEGLSLVMIAIRGEQLLILEYLVNQGANLEIESKSADFVPPVTAFGFVDSRGLPEEIREIYYAILNQTELNADTLGPFIFESIRYLNVALVNWLLQKGADPNFIGPPPGGGKDVAPLILLLSTGYEADKTDELSAVEEIFVILTEHPDIDVNLKVKRKTALKWAKTQALIKPHYQQYVDRLIDLGAKK